MRSIVMFRSATISLSSYLAENTVRVSGDQWNIQYVYLCMFSCYFVRFYRNQNLISKIHQYKLFSSKFCPVAIKLFHLDRRTRRSDKSNTRFSHKYWPHKHTAPSVTLTLHSHLETPWQCELCAAWISKLFLHQTLSSYLQCRHL
jgi:hypothetical protein